MYCCTYHISTRIYIFIHLLILQVPISEGADAKNNCVMFLKQNLLRRLHIINVSDFPEFHKYLSSLIKLKISLYLITDINRRFLRLSNPKLIFEISSDTHRRQQLYTSYILLESVCWIYTDVIFSPEKI